jgi:LacI family transcriptional regulator
LYSLGHRRIAFVGGPQDLTTAKRRERAYLEFCRSRNLEVPARFVQVGDYTMQSGREAGLFLLGINARPTAILAANDMMAFGVIESAHELDINIPREVSVAGFDDLPTAAERFPSLTTVHQPVAEMAERSAQLLVDALNSGELPKNQITFPVSLVTRASTAAPARDSKAKKVRPLRH